MVDARVAAECRLGSQPHQCVINRSPPPHTHPCRMPLPSPMLSNQVARLWTHEAERVFRDRMVTEADMARFDEFRSGWVGRAWARV